MVILSTLWIKEVALVIQQRNAILSLRTILEKPPKHSGQRSMQGLRQLSGSIVGELKPRPYDRYCNGAFKDSGR